MEGSSSTMTPRRSTTESTVKLAACEPCREAKVACNHARPICSRCQQRNTEDDCVYRASPFKKRKIAISKGISTRADIPPSISSDIESVTLQSDLRAASSVEVSGLQPNPNFLGSSSYTNIFSQLTTDSSMLVNANDDIGPAKSSAQALQPNHITTRRANQGSTIQGVRLLEDIMAAKLIPTGKSLMNRWFEIGFNTALVSAFSQRCVEATFNLLERLKPESLHEEARRLSTNSMFKMHNQVELAIYIDDFCRDNLRWEALSLCFSMLPRASFDLSPLEDASDKNGGQAQEFRKETMRFSDQCLEMALALDSLNDLQLFSQYENFISHSYVDGDQSYESWRKLGDVTSSLYALGYHEDVLGSPPAPEWLHQIRKSVVARAYSADKNIAIFLGRPPRINRKFFSSKVLGQIVHDLHTTECNNEVWYLPVFDGEFFSYDIDTWWSAMCARLKEEALDLSRESDKAEQVNRASIIDAHALAQWESLPKKYRLEGLAKEHSPDPRVRDFVVGAKLNHFHVLFITKIALTKFNPRISEQLVITSAAILSIICEAVLLKSWLRNSGTTLIWKVIYYGLPAAGVLCLYLLDSTSNALDDGCLAKVIQDLNVLVAHIASRAFTDVLDPNFGALDNASKAIQTILEKLMSRARHNDRTSTRAQETGPDFSTDYESAQWLTWNNFSFQDSENDFWLNIADHPALY